MGRWFVCVCCLVKEMLSVVDAEHLQFRGFIAVGIHVFNLYVPREVIQNKLSCTKTSPPDLIVF